MMQGRRSASSIGNIVVAMVACAFLALMASGCGTSLVDPSGLEPSPDPVVAGEVVEATDDPNADTDPDDRNPDIEPNMTADDSPISVESQTVLVMVNTSTTVTLAGRDRQKSDIESSDLTFSITSGPENGTLGVIDNSLESSASVTYTPQAQFIGTDAFTFAASNGTEVSEEATVTIVVLPQVRFTVDPVIGHRPLTVTCAAANIPTAVVPDILFIWTVDGVEDAGPMATHSRWTHVFRTAGIHTITLTLVIAGCTEPISCVSTQTNTPEARVSVWPQISGKVVDMQGKGIAGVTVSANAGGTTAVTDAQGYYAVEVPYNWSGQVTPQHVQYAFDRPNRSYANVSKDIANQDFVATSLAGPVLSGYVRDAEGNGIAGISLSASNGGGSATTDQNGYYELTVGHSWSGTVTPTHSSYTFDPVNRSYSEVIADMSNQSFEGTRNLLTISGNVHAPDGSALAGVALSAVGTGDSSGDDASVTTQENGNYALSIPGGWSGTVTPSSGGYSFSPASRAYANLAADRSDEDYIGGPAGDAPIANAGSDRNAGLGTHVVLDGSASTDHLGGTNVTYLWEQLSGPAVTLTGSETASARFVAPDGLIADTFALTFRLTVTDNETSLPHTDTLNINVSLTKQSLLNRIHLAAIGHYNVAVRFPDGQGGNFVGWAQARTVDEGTPWYENEGHAWAEDGPMLGIQPPATPTVGYAYVKAYQATGNKHYLAIAQSVGDTLLAIQGTWNGGWHYDMCYEGGEWRAVMVWSERRRDYTTSSFLSMLQGAATLDDNVSQSAALFLLRLYQAGGGSKYLDGAKQFGDLLANLKNVQDPESGQFPYQGGGIPQVMPFDVAMGINFGGWGTPGDHYYAHKTLNDGTTKSALLFLMDLYAETDDQKYLDAIRLNVDYLLGRHAAYGNRAWCQQYHYLTDEPAWARGKEPPAFVSGEDSTIELLLAWWSRETDATRKQRIENAIHSALMYWKYEAPQIPDEPVNKWWRYYNVPREGFPFTEPGNDAQPINEVVFAKDYNVYYGAENEGMADGGQPYRMHTPERWLWRILDDNDNLDLSDLSAHQRYFAVDNILSLGSGNLATAYEDQDVETGLWTKSRTLGGESRICAYPDTNAGRLIGLCDALEDYPGPVTDSDADGYADSDELAAGTDPQDSRSAPE